MLLAGPGAQFIKLHLEHNLSSLKIPEVRVDPLQTVQALKEEVERRYGSKVNFVRLTLKNRNGEKVCDMEEDFRTLKFYGVEDGYVVFVNDLNPHSIHKEIEDLGQVQKYKISEEEYNNLPQNFRKWKAKHVAKATAGGALDPAMMDADYLKAEAEQVAVGERCMISAGHRGVVSYVGKVPDLGVGYFVGVSLDEPFGNCNGKLLGVSYFECQDNYGVFVRPFDVDTGDYPVLSMDDQL